MKKTIAVIGAGAEKGAAIADKIGESNYRLLLVQNEINNKSQLVKNIKRKNLHVEVEIIDCAKEGCWEADIIILAIPFHEIKEVVEKINEVVTQKIVVIISDEKESSFSFNRMKELQRQLPYSTIVTASYNPHSPDLFIINDDKKITEIISE